MNKKHLSMRWRFTLIVGICMLAIIGIVTAISIFNAKQQFTIVSKMAEPDYTLSAESAGVSIIATSSDESMIPSSIYLVPMENPMLNQQQPNPSLLPPYNDNNMNEVVLKLENMQVAINSAEQNYTGITLALMIVFAIFSMVITYFIVGRMLKPLHDFEAKINTVSENNFSAALWSQEEIRSDEIGQLQQAFQAMSQRLETAFIKQKRFSLDAAHELKTPVAVIKTGIQVLDMDSENDIDEYKDTMRIVSNNIDRLSAIIDDLLCFSSHDDLPFERVDLSLLLQSIIQEMHLIASESDIEISFSSEPISILAHATLLHRAFCNIIENAIKYNQTNGHIWITAKQTNQTIEISICNTGTPIPVDKIDQIFEPFYRIDPSRSKKINGHGLGLSITKDIIEKHQGNIQVIVDHDTNTFIITLPI